MTPKYKAMPCIKLLDQNNSTPGVRDQKQGLCFPVTTIHLLEYIVHLLCFAYFFTSSNLGSAHRVFPQTKLFGSPAGRAIRAGDTPQPSPPAPWEGNRSLGWSAKTGCQHLACLQHHCKIGRVIHHGSGLQAPNSRSKGLMCTPVIPGCLRTLCRLVGSLKFSSLIIVSLAPPFAAPIYFTKSKLPVTNLSAGSSSPQLLKSRETKFSHPKN